MTQLCTTHLTDAATAAAAAAAADDDDDDDEQLSALTTVYKTSFHALHCQPVVDESHSSRAASTWANRQ